MINSHHTIGIVLKRNNYGEADRLVVVFTEKFGKITLIAKGVRRLKSKIAGSIELFSISDLTVSKGKNLFVLTASSMIKPFKPHQDLAEIKLASLISEIIIKTIPDESPNNKVFNLLYESFSAFGLGLKLNILSSYFASSYIYLSGVSPNLDTCIQCGSKPKDTIFFSNLGNGLLDKDCTSLFPDAQEITQNTVKAWRFSIENDLTRFRLLKISNNDLNQLTYFTTNYLKQNIQITIKSDLL